MPPHLETLAVHTANEPDPVTGAVAPGIQLSTTFARGEDGELVGPFSYSRAGNPNRAALEAALAALEGGAAAFAFASGTAAIAAVFQTLAPGDHVIAPADVYHGTRSLLERMSGWGLEVSYGDLDQPGALPALFRDNTRLVLVETPSNPLLRITDIAAAAELAHAAGARLAVDNTWATPVLQRPLALGADFSVHSSTKYLGGHGDVLGGAVVCREADRAAETLRELQATLGAVPGPFDCWLVRRGLMTLPLRIRAQAQSAARIAAFLASHPAVSRVHYPGLPDHPGAAVASRQMAAPGAMLSFQLHGGEAAAQAAVRRARLFTRATSLGSVESLVEHRYRVEGPHSRTPRDLLRLSIGLEHVDDLLEDVQRWFEG